MPHFFIVIATFFLALPASAQVAAEPPNYTAEGASLLTHGQYPEARAAFTRALRHHNTATAHFDLARVAFAEGDYQRARRDCRAVVRLDETWGHVCMARAYLAWSRSARAFEELEAALTADPNHFEALLALGDAHRLRADIEESEDAYQRALRARPSALVHRGLGLLYLAAGHRDRARAAFTTAVQMDGELPEAHYWLGTLSSGAEALSHYQRAAEVRPSYSAAQNALGFSLMAAESNTEARAAFERALLVNEDDAVAHEGLGRVLTRSAEYEAAEVSIRRSLELVPNSYRAAIALAELFRARGDVEGALLRYREAATLDPANPWAMMASAHLALQNERAVLAMGFLTAVLGHHPNLARAHVLFGDALRMRGEMGPARERYQRALSAEGPIMRQYVQRMLREP